MGARGTRSKQRAVAPALSARLHARVRLEAQANGEILACFDGNAASLGWFSADVAQRAQNRNDLPFGGPSPGTRKIDKEMNLLVRQLAGHGLLQYQLTRDNVDLMSIEPQVVDYSPQTPPLDLADTLVLSRFAYVRRRDGAIVLESPRAGALFKIHDPAIVTALALLATPQQIRQLRKQEDFPGLAFLALLVDCHILLKNDTDEDGLAPAKSDHSLAFWEFHDLLFHARSTGGRHANPIGGTYQYAGTFPPLPVVRHRWPGKAIDLHKISVKSEPIASMAKLLRDRHSIRSFDDQRPITLAELAQFLDTTARILSKSRAAAAPHEESPAEMSTVRPYPSAGASYELELYVAVNHCEGLAPGFYHYDADAHALVPIIVSANDIEALFAGAQYAMGAPAPSPILLTITARFGRVAWKYSSIAYALILKDVGVLTQTFYLTATAMGLGGCAIGIVNIDLFAKMTGVEFHVEGPVGQFALGRPLESERPAAAPDD